MMDFSSKKAPSSEKRGRDGAKEMLFILRFPREFQQE
jgi:hypothetical protein